MSQGLAGGKIGGKRRLVTMSKAKRVHLAYIAGLQGGAPIRIDHEKVKALRDAGKKWREIAERIGISMASVTRFWRSRSRKSKSRPRQRSLERQRR